MRKIQSAKIKGQLTKDDWVEMALKEMSKVGEKGLRIDVLCRQLGVTKGSFYSHFKNRDDLLDSILRYWSRQQPEYIATQLQTLKGGAVDRLHALLLLSVELDVLNRDAAIREWARYNEKVAASLEMTDRMIVSLIEEILQDAGLNRDNSFIYARLLFLSSLGAKVAPWLGGERMADLLGEVLNSIPKNKT